jgi:hypothetical protein
METALLGIPYPQLSLAGTFGNIYGKYLLVYAWCTFDGTDFGLNTILFCFCRLNISYI